ncbi:unnamed protein product [Schistosoma curassoni]|uniref:Uncharacterized protein n=1 Tax=Schistosoma curassoni TaxID=6186 RepID=A0A183KSK5_9TREM|nr:unnamed protein product [Schistosoma curassoni]
MQLLVKLLYSTYNHYILPVFQSPIDQLDLFYYLNPFC